MGSGLLCLCGRVWHIAQRCDIDGRDNMGDNLIVEDMWLESLRQRLLIEEVFYEYAAQCDEDMLG